MESLGPFQVLACWQVAVLAVLVSTITTGAKRGLDLLAGGKDQRKTRWPWVSLAVMSLLPMSLGAVLAIVLPIQPAMLVDYTTTMQAKHLTTHPNLVFGLWGTFVGAVADLVYHKIRVWFERGEASVTVRVEGGGRAVVSDRPPP